MQKKHKHFSININYESKDSNHSKAVYHVSSIHSLMIVL